MREVITLATLVLIFMDKNTGKPVQLKRIPKGVLAPGAPKLDVAPVR